MRSTGTRPASGPTRAFGAVKRLLQAGQQASLAAQLDAEARAISQSMATDDAQQAVKAFLARQAPTFKGA